MYICVCIFNYMFNLLTDVGSSRKDVENFCTVLEEKAVCTYSVWCDVSMFKCVCSCRENIIQLHWQGPCSRVPSWSVRIWDTLIFLHHLLLDLSSMYTKVLYEGVWWCSSFPYCLFYMYTICSLEIFCCEKILLVMKPTKIYYTKIFNMNNRHYEVFIYTSTRNTGILYRDVPAVIGSGQYWPPLR